ncbi:hypothetical protein LCGC14_2570070 [marine sediment metagenome]|uniref:Single-stranded DNA-binding protein n=1 Tax=marine sediment metagenome TaxID=412755 RepID=A0A0F9B5D0_9ZZZZ
MSDSMICELLPKVMKSIRVIGKSQENSFDKYKFRGIDDVYNAVQPALVEHGVTVVPTVQEVEISERLTAAGKSQTRATLTVQYTFYAPDASCIHAVVVGQAEDRSDKACNKAMSAAFKYALFQVFCIPTEGDNDADAKTPQSAPATKPDTPKTLPKPNMVRFRDAFDNWIRVNEIKSRDHALDVLGRTHTITDEVHAFITEQFEGYDK